MTSFQSAFDRIKNAASTAGLDTQAPAAPAGDAFARIAKAAASVEPGAAPGGAAGEQDIMRTAAQQYEGDLLVQEDDAKTARYFMFGLNPREIERGFWQGIEQTAQAVATPGLRAQFIESVLNPLFAVAAPWALPTAPMMGRLGAMATEPAGSGLTVDDLRTEQIAARGAAMGRMAGAQEGVMGDISRALGQTAPQMLGVAAAVATGGGAAPIVAANLMGNANIPLSAWTAGQLEYFDEIDQKRAEQALSGQPMSTYSLDEMRKRATISAVAEAGPEIIGGAVAGKVIGGAAKAIIKTRAGRATVAALSERGRPLAEAVLSSKAGQAGAEAFARASDGTLKFRNGFFGQAGKIIAASAVEEGAEELGSAIIQAPFNEAPLSNDLKNGLYSAFIGSVAGGVGGVGAVGGAVAARGIQNRRDAFRPETNREIRLRQAHTDAMKARTNWSADLDESQQARVSIALNSLDGMAQEERGIYLRELADRRQDIANDVEAALALRQQLNDALAGARAAQQQFESGAPERAAKDTLVKETEAALAKANADFEAAREMLAEAELATEATRSAVLREERQAQVEEARREVDAVKQRADAAMSEATVAEGLEIAPGLRINPAEQVALLEQQIGDIDAEMQMSVHDKMIADATYNAVREKVADMPMDYVQRTPQEVLSEIGSDQGTTLDPIAAPKNGARVTREMQALGLEVQWFRGKGKKFSSPGFFSMASRNTVFLNADYASGDIRATAMEELFHQIQMFRPEIAQAYSTAVGVAPIYEQGIRYSQRAAETSAKARLDEAALQQAGAAIAEVGGDQAAVPESVRRAGAARLQQEGEANLFARTSGRLTRGGALQPFVRFAARRGLMGREVYAAMSVIDAVSRAAAIERVAGKKPSPTLSPLARTLLWAEDADIQLDRDIADAERPEQPTAEAAKAPAAGVSMAREFPSRPLSSFTPEWRAWFSDSKVVDADGNPMVLYHGTTSDIQEFDPEAPGKFDAGWLGRGSYFTSNPDTASYYASYRLPGAAGPNVVPVYVSLQNPLILSRTEKRSKSQEMALALGVSISGMNANEQEARMLRDAAIEQGYDGVIFTYRSKFVSEQEVVAFRPNQIKSVLNERPTSAPGISMARSSDAEYLAAVERGDMTTAQRMVDEAAKAAGAIVAYYGSPRSFKPEVRDGKPVFLADNIGTSLGYTRGSGLKNVQKSYLRFANPFVIDASGQPWYEIPVSEDDAARLGFSENQIGLLRGVISTETIANVLSRGGFDGAIIKNVVDDIDSGAKPSTTYIVTNNESFVSADPVTSDEAGNVIPLSKRFDVSRPEISFARATDEEYFAAIERGDMPAVQRMVEAAAKSAGYIYRVFHGTNGPLFEQFSKTEGGSKTGAESAQLGFFATDNPAVAQSYADNPGMGSMFDLALGGPLSELRSRAVETGRGKELKDAYDAAKSEYDAAIQRGRAKVRENVANSDVIANLRKAGFENEIESFIDRLTISQLMQGEWIESPEIVAAEESRNRAGKPLQAFVMDVIVSSLPNRRVLNMYAKMENPAIYDAGGVTPADFSLTPKIQKAISDGNDGVIFRNLIDPVEPSTHYVVFDPEQFKSADPVTRDEAGNVIPLSKRFDVSRPEISFARPEEDAEIQSLREQVAELKRQIRDVQNVTAAQRVNALREVRVLERRLVTAERLAEQKTLQATRAKARVVLEQQAREEDKVAAEAAIAKMETKLDAAIASVKSMRADIASLRRTARNTEQEIADAEATAQRAIDWAYAIGRNAGRMAGEIRGQQVKQREVKALTKRLEFVEPRLQQAREAIREARKDIKADAAAAQRAIDFAYGMGLAKGRLQGVMEGRRQVLVRMAKREDALQNQMFNLRRMMQARADQAEEVRDAAQSIARDAASTLPVALRGPLAVRIAGVKTLAQANRIAVEAVKLAANSEVDKSVDAIRSLRKAMKKRGMRISTRTRIEQMLNQAEAGLRTASGRKIRAAVTPAKGPKAVMAGPALVNAVDIYAAVVDAATLVEQAALLHAADRQAFLQMRAARIARYDALRQGLAQAMTGRPTLQERERGDQPPMLSYRKQIARANSDIYTLMLELEGTEAGIINELLSAAQAGKGEASLEHAAILRQLESALQAAGYASIDDYALANGLLGEASAQLRDVTLGGQTVTLPVGTIMSVAAMDDETLALFPDVPTAGSQRIKFGRARTTKSYAPTKGEIRALLAGLSQGERDLIASMKNILETQIRDRVMDAVYAVEGDQPPVVPNYWPRIREAAKKGDAKEVLQVAGALVRGALTSVGFAQARTGGTEALLYSDAFQTWERHVQVALDMIHMAQPYRDAVTVLSDDEVVRLMDMQMGEGTADRVLAIFANGVGATARDNVTIVDKLSNNVTGATIAMRPRTLAKVVLGGQIRLASEIPAEYWARGVGRASRQTTNPFAWNARIEEIHSVNGYFTRRHQLHMRTIVSGALSDSDRVRITTAYSAAIDSIRAAGNNVAAANMTDALGRLKDAANGANLMIASAVDALRYMDEQVMLAAVEARLAEVDDEGLLTGQDALREAALRAERDFRRTQNASDEFDESAFVAYQRVLGTGGAARMLFVFSSDPLKARNQIRRAYLSGNRRLATTAAITGNMAANTVITTASIATSAYAISLIAGLLGGDEPTEEEDKEFKKAVQGVPLNVVRELLASTLGFVGITMGWAIDAYQYRSDPAALIVGRPASQAIREITKDQDTTLKVSGALLAMSQYIGVPIYGLFDFVRKLFDDGKTTSGGRKPAEPKTERQKILDRIERRRREIEKLRQGG